MKEPYWLKCDVEGCRETTVIFPGAPLRDAHRYEWTTNWVTGLDTCPAHNRLKHCKEIEVPYNKHFERRAS